MLLRFYNGIIVHANASICNLFHDRRDSNSLNLKQLGNNYGETMRILLTLLLLYPVTIHAAQPEICPEKVEPYKNEVDLIATFKDHFTVTIEALNKAGEKFPDVEFKSKLDDITYIYAHVVEDMEAWALCFDNVGEIFYRSEFSENDFSNERNFKNRLIKNHLAITRIYNSIKPYHGNFDYVYNVFDVDIHTSQIIQLQELKVD